MDQLIEGFQRVANQLRVLVLEWENLTEFVDHAIEDGHCNLLRINVRGEGILQVGVPHLKTFMHNVMFVWLHFYISLFFKN